MLLYFVYIICDIVWEKEKGNETKKKKSDTPQLCVHDLNKRQMAAIFSLPTSLILWRCTRTYAIFNSDGAHIFEIPDILFILL